MSQTKQISFVEALSNTAIGFLITLILSKPIYWLWDIDMNWGQMTGVTITFTLVSVARGYIIRRWFNSREK